MLLLDHLYLGPGLALQLPGLLQLSVEPEGAELVVLLLHLGPGHTSTGLHLLFASDFWLTQS